MTPTLTQVLLALIALAGGVGVLVAPPPRDGAMTARETYARGVGSYEGQ